MAFGICQIQVSNAYTLIAINQIHEAIMFGSTEGTVANSSFDSCKVRKIDIKRQLQANLMSICTVVGFKLSWPFKFFFDIINAGMMFGCKGTYQMSL